MLKLIEPTRGITTIKLLNTTMTNSSVLTHRAPILADIFVFSYPIYLGGLYIMGRVSKKLSYKQAALTITASTAASMIVNIGIQFFVDKTRPNFVLGLTDLKQETILHHFLPSASFPSDHAALSMSIAVASLLRAYTQNDKKYFRFGSILLIFALIMTTARVMTAVHRPTDILGGFAVGIIIPCLLFFCPPLAKLISKIALWIGRKI